MIRPLVFTDTPSYRELRLQALKTDPGAFLSSYEHESLQPLSYFTYVITRANIPPIFGIYGYLESEKLVGTIQLSPETLPKTAHRAMIYFLYIATGHRHENVASGLLQHLIALAKTVPNLEQLHLCVNGLNIPAISLYEKLGFKKIGTKPQGVKEPDGSYQDEYLYYLSLR